MDPDSRRLRVTVTDGRGRPVRDGGLARWLAAVAPARTEGEVAVALVTDAHSRRLNHAYRSVDAATDVLSFPDALSPDALDPTSQPRLLGDIVIASGVARRQARERRHAVATELRVLALHGLLHLLGYDHEDPDDRGRMARVETRLRRKGRLREGLIARGGRAASRDGGPTSRDGGPNRRRAAGRRSR